MLKIYHNARCSKSREACSILQEKNIPFETIDYLKTPPSQKEIKELLKKLGMKAEEIVRKGEVIYKEKYKNKTFSETEWINILSENPILIERPILVKGDKAVIGRPPEKVLELI
ncbi:MAG: arsenate reductase (glutaredoxin) [Bacteroidetes bacterium RIFCSPLOWO2_12_FULL_35_15]|nr:MAG: arsenate reductase (glutaredoxin) [Bacteroidetes bacterium RIFCSPLOWO2_12_FULL_35_15]